MSSSVGLSPRQKMINMMYLVLMAMLALNVSKEILTAFGRINESLEATTLLFSDKNAIIYTDLKSKSVNNPEKYIVLYERSVEVKKRSDQLVDLIQGYKDELIEITDARQDDGTISYPDIDKESQDEYFYPTGSLSLGKGQEFSDAIDSYRSFVLTQIKRPSVVDRINRSFNTEPVKVDGVTQNWLKNKFEGYPLAASLAFLTQIQADVRNAEADMITSMVSESLGEQINVNKVSALMIPKSTNVMQGGAFDAKIVMAAYDTTLTPEIYLYDYDSRGNRVGERQNPLEVEEGSGIVNIPTPKVGSFFWGGVVRIKNEEGKYKEYPFQSEYSVSQPAVVISATKMNVLYRGVKNPISVSISGIPDRDVIVQAPGIRRISGTNYEIDITSYRGRQVSIKTSAKLPSGATKSFPPAIYRIKDIPAPMGTVAGESDTKMPLGTLKVATVEAVIPDFEFDLKLNVTSFKVKIPGRPTYTVRGNKLDAKVKKALDRVRVGQTVQIRDISVKLPGNSSYKVAKVSTVLVTINSK